MKNLLIKLFANSAIKVFLFYAMFRVSVYFLSSFYAWERSIQRGILWQTYLIYFAIIVFCINALLLFWKRNKLRNSLIAGTMGLLTLVICFFESIKYLPYTVLLPHTIALFILLLLPILSYKLGSPQPAHP